MRWIYSALFLYFFIYPIKVMSNSYVEIYGSLPYISDMKISPSGNKVAYLQSNEGQHVLVHKKLLGKSEQKAFGVTEGHIRNFRWLNDERIALEMSMPIYSPADYEQFTIWRVKLFNLNTNESTPLSGISVF